MSKYLNVVTLLLSLVPQIIAMVKAIELPGNGADKAAAVISIVKETLTVLPEDLRKLIGADKVEGWLSTIISIVVNFLNKTGYFPKPE